MEMHSGLPPGRLRWRGLQDQKASQRAKRDIRLVPSTILLPDSTLYLSQDYGCPSMIKMAAESPIPGQSGLSPPGPSAFHADVITVIVAETLLQTAHYILTEPDGYFLLPDTHGISRYLAWIDRYCETHHLHFHNRGWQMRAGAGFPEEVQDAGGEAEHTSTRSEQGQEEKKSTIKQQRQLTWPGITGKKRSAKSEDPSDDEEGKRPRKSNQQNEKTLKFACPFYKHNPDEFVDERSCCGPGWHTVQRVKEHVLRKHKAPDNQCPRCFEEFKDNNSLMQHARAQVICKVRENPCSSSQLDENKMKLLKQRSKTTATEIEKWKSMYQMIFPGERSLPSPYYDLEDRIAVLPSRAVAQRMFRDNLKGVLSKRGLGDAEMSLVISGAMTAFDATFTAMCKQETSPCSDNSPPGLGGPVVKEEDDNKLDFPLVTDFDGIFQSSSQPEETTELAPDDGSNTALHYGLAPDLTNLSTEIRPPETELHSGHHSGYQQQMQQLYQSQLILEPGPFNGSLPARNATPQYQDLLGISGGIFDGHLGSEYIIRNGVGMEPLTHTDTQSFRPELAGYSYEHAELLSLGHEDMSDLLPFNYQCGPDVSELPYDIGPHYKFKTDHDPK